MRVTVLHCCIACTSNEYGDQLLNSTYVFNFSNQHVAVVGIMLIVFLGDVISKILAIAKHEEYQCIAIHINQFSLMSI